MNFMAQYTLARGTI